LEQIEEEFACNHVVLDRKGTETAPLLRNVQELRMLDHYYWNFEKVPFLLLMIVHIAELQVPLIT
jgi:hypothetical protein